MGVEKIRTNEKSVNALLDTVQLHDSRFQVYLPFAAPFNTREALGVGDSVMAVLEAYMIGVDFGIDHVSVLTSESPNSDQSLHPDVPGFTRLQLSVHTALQDITPDMGPTSFCPCTGEVREPEAWPTTSAVKMVALQRRECLAESYAPKMTKRGTVTIYDGATFHKGLANDSGRNRDVLKLELGANDFPVRRNYLEKAPKAGKKQTNKFRAAFGPPRL